MTNASQVLSELLSVLRTSLTHYDLSDVDGTHHVVIADSGLPRVSLPVVLLSAPAVDVDYEGGSSLGEYHVRGTIDWWGYVAPPTTGLEDRVTAALELASDVVEAVQAAHADPANTVLHGLVVLLPGRVEIYGDGPEIPPGAGVCAGQIVYETYLSGGL